MLHLDQLTFSDICQFKTINKLSYQILCANPNQILREVEADIHEGADMVMVKPGITSLDLICKIKEKFDFPVAVQNVSGEYAMVKAAAMHGWIKEDEWKINSIASIKRAGADKIISYFTMDLCKRYLIRLKTDITLLRNLLTMSWVESQLYSISVSNEDVPR